MYYGDKVILRGLEKSDVDNIMEYWNDLEIRQYLASYIPYSKEEEEDWIKSTIKARKRGSGFIFAIEDHNGNWLGTAGIGVNSFNRSGTLGIAIHPKDKWGKGYGTDAMITLCGFGFLIVNLNRIELEVHDFNERAYKSYIKVGFQEVGKKRQAHYFLGEYHDSIIMDFLRDEFLSKYPAVDLMKIGASKAF